MLMKSKTVTSSANAALALLLAVNLFNYIDRFVLAAVAPEIQKDFKASDELTGLLQTAFLVSYMVFAPLFGWLADRFRRWLLIGVGVVIWSFASGASGLAAGIGILLITRLFVGIGEAAYGPTAPTVISDMYPIASRGRVLAWFYAAIPVGSALGFVLGSLILNSGLSWHWAFFVVLPPGLLLGCVCFLMRDPPRGAAEHVVPIDAPLPQKAKLSDYRVLLRTPSYILNTAGMAAMTFAMGGIAFWMPKYVVWHSHETISLAKANGIFGPIIVVSGLLGTLAGGAAGDRLRARFGGAYFLVSGAAMMIAFPLVLLLPVTPFPAAWVLIFFASFCLFFNTGPTNTILANVTHVSIRAAGYALNIFVIHALGDAISPWLIGKINDQWREGTAENMDPGFIAVSITILLGGICWIWGARYLARDTELAPTRLAS